MRDKRAASHHSWSYDRRSRVQNNVCMPGAQNVNGRSQNRTNGFRTEVSYALHTGRRWVSGLHYDWRWNMGFSPHSWIQVTVTATAPYAFPQNLKIQNFNFSGKNHGIHFWDRKGILLVHFMPPGTTINAAAYCDTLTRFWRDIHNKRTEMLSCGVACSTTTCSPILRSSPLCFWKNSSGIYWTIRHTVWTLCPAISTCFFT